MSQTSDEFDPPGRPPSPRSQAVETVLDLVDEAVGIAGMQLRSASTDEHTLEVLRWSEIARNLSQTAYFMDSRPTRWGVDA